MDVIITLFIILAVIMCLFTITVLVLEWVWKSKIKKMQSGAVEEKKALAESNKEN